MGVGGSRTEQRQRNLKHPNQVSVTNFHPLPNDLGQGVCPARFPAAHRARSLVLLVMP